MFHYFCSSVLRASSLLAIVVCGVGYMSIGLARPFTVADGIEVSHFGDPYTGEVKPITFSPDGAWVVVVVEGGDLARNRPRNEIRLYRSRDLERFLDDRNAEAPAPVWSLVQSPHIAGPLVGSITWLADSTGFTYLRRTDPLGNRQLVLANVRDDSQTTLTAESLDVTAFSIQDIRHYAFTARDPRTWADATRSARAGVSAVFTGKPFYSVFFPDDLYPSEAWHDRSDLWVVDGGAPRQIARMERPLALFREGQDMLSLSPDGSLLMTALPVAEIPANWGERYPASFPGDPYHFKSPQAQNVDALDGTRFLHQYVLIDVATGKITAPADAPTGRAAGWSGSMAKPAWSQDQRYVVLPDTFMGERLGGKSGTPPCVAVFDRKAGSLQCIERMVGKSAQGFPPQFKFISAVQFGDARGTVVTMEATDVTGARQTLSYQRTSAGAWQLQSTASAAPAKAARVSLFVQEGLDERPVLMVSSETGRKPARALWDPNPQLAQIELGEASVYRWQDAQGRQWIGGLYRPVGYQPGKRYPLVIQTHGFAEQSFRPDGVYPTAFAARALAAAGIAVLQVRDCPIRATAQEAPCQIAGYEAAVRKLEEEGIIDPQAIGIVGYSRTCYYVLAALTSGRIDFKAASVTDGVNEGYLQYLSLPDRGGSIDEASAMNGGAPPYGSGLALWMQNAPTFNMHKVSAPLQVVGLGMPSLLSMWEPYAILRLQRKPVDLVLINTINAFEHVMTNPATRLASQGGTVDWMRFWLQGYEDSDPAKATQYERWRKMKELQGEQKPSGTAGD